MTNCTAFLDVNKRLGDKPALVFPDENLSITYEDLLTQVCRRSRYYLNSGIKKGERVCIYLPPNTEYLISYLALWRIGAAAVPLNNALRAAEIKYMVENSGASGIVTDESGYKTTEEAMEILDKNVCAVPQIFISGTVLWEEKLREMPDYMRAENCSQDDLCQLLYTSGTTGVQKGAMLTHGNWMAAMNSITDLLQMRMDDTYLGIYPMAHAGVSWGISALKAGATWMQMSRFDLEKYKKYISDYKATIVAAMPPVIHTLTKEPEGTEKFFESARCMISGGGPLLPSIWKDFYERYHLAVINAYGLSETIVVGTGTAIRPEDYRYADEFKSVGCTTGFSEIKIVDISDPEKELPIGEDGEIALRGPAVAKGYWGLPVETEKSFRPDGWFLTGDIGYLDNDGRLYITDRKKDMIVMSGWKIYPTEVEKTYIEHKCIDDIAVFSCPDGHRGEIPAAAIILKKGAKITEKELIDFGMEKLVRYKVPRKFIFVDELPRVNGWKLLRRELREKYASQVCITENKE